MIGETYKAAPRTTMTWLDAELRSILEREQNAVVNADAMLRTLKEIRDLTETKEAS